MEYQKKAGHSNKFERGIVVGARGKTVKALPAATALGTFGLWLTFAIPLSADDLPASPTEKTEATRLREVLEVERLNAMYQIHRDREYRAHRNQIENNLPAVSATRPDFAPAKQAPSFQFDIPPVD